jgi:quinohemoprotein ethanol dehydrogenase
LVHQYIIKRANDLKKEMASAKTAATQ